MVNPYLTPGSQPIAKQRGEYKFTPLFVLLYFYPLLPVAGAYLAWGLSTVALERMSVAYRDYPETLAILFCGYTGGITLLIAPLIVPFGVWVAVWRPFWLRFNAGRLAHNAVDVTRWFLSLGGFCAVVAIVCLLFCYDPAGVLTWFLD